MSKKLQKTSVVVILLGTILATFSQIIVEDILGIERAFGEEPLSITVTEVGLVMLLLGVILFVYASWKKRK
jgi:ABC-type Fe3+-siderophore transport system permease subunit